jgi:hypothetical protein
MDPTSLYEILGVSPFASRDAIIRAYRRLARKYHPDINKSPDAEERMKEINRAYDVLGDKEKRWAYDRDRKIVKQHPICHEGTWQYSHQTPEQTHKYRHPPSPVSSPPRHYPLVVIAGIFLLLLAIGLSTLAGTSRGTAAGLQPATAVPQPAAVPGAVATVAVTMVQTVTAEMRPVQKTFKDWQREGDGYLLQHRNGDALAAFKQALAIQPNASEIWVAEGYSFEIMGDFYGAVACYDRAIALNPRIGEWVRVKSRILDNQSGMMERADQLSENGDDAAAIAIYDEILAAGIQNADFEKRVLSAKVYALMRSGKMQEAARVTKDLETL